MFHGEEVATHLTFCRGESQEGMIYTQVCWHSSEGILHQYPETDDNLGTGFFVAAAATATKYIPMIPMTLSKESTKVSHNFQHPRNQSLD